MRATLAKQFGFEAAHQLPHVPPDHKCARMHGHSFKVEVRVSGEVDPRLGWVFDHAELSRAMDPLIKQLDHRLLNEIPGLENPTFEHLARWIWEKLKPAFPGLRRITVFETASASCIYEGE
ncbi:MAG: 6-carboxytetrahydropterin synthase QueD [Verrucomicrobiae bacterium]|nr:6-carboxytetrahydropterin synthase QueD [Verrucomicrobiae bacterium]